MSSCFSSCCKLACSFISFVQKVCSGVNFIYDTFVVVFFFGTMITAFKETKMLYFILYLPIQINF